MPDQSGLERRYRRLLLAFPKRYRRLRGEEMLTTLLEAAKPGQTRPGTRDAVHLLGRGLRSRLTPAPGWVAKAVAVAVTLQAALVLASLGAHAVWSRSTVVPNGSAAMNVSDDLLGRPADRSIAAQELGTWRLVFDRENLPLPTYDLDAEGWAGKQPAPQEIRRLYRPVKNVDAVMNEARAKLQRDGWTMGASAHRHGNPVFWASRGDLLLRMEGDVRNEPAPHVVVTFHQAEPEYLGTAWITGLLLGLLVFWLIMVGLTHRFAVLERRARITILLFGVPVALACAAVSTQNLLTMYWRIFKTNGSGVDLMYPVSSIASYPVAATVAAAGIIACVAVLTAASPRRL